MGAKILTVAGVLVFFAVPAGALAKPPLVEPDEGPDPRGLTLQGSGLGRVEVPTRLNERTIRGAVAGARLVAQRDALRNARVRARALAKAAGLTLGTIQAVTDRLSDSERFVGPDRYCRRRGCRVPPFAGASVRVTFATVETSSVAAAGPVIVASGGAFAKPRPKRRTSPSIRAALGRAQLAADPLALAAARRRATGLAEAAGFTLGSLFALAEEPRQPFFGDLLTGIFGPGRFCRRAGRTRVRRCYPPAASSVLRVTFVAGG